MDTAAVTAGDTAAESIITAEAMVMVTMAAAVITDARRAKQKGLLQWMRPFLIRYNKA